MTLGRTENKHVKCHFVGHSDDCPKDCSKCAISMKVIGDNALTENKISDAIKHFKKALFAEPRYAEAWYGLATAYGMISENNNALSAYNKALSIDPKYGEAMFGKAKTLLALGKPADAMAMANEILELYDDSSVQSFKAELEKAGIRDTAEVFTLQKAIDTMTDNAYDIIVRNNLIDKDGQIHTIQKIDNKEVFSSRIFEFCKKRFGSLGKEKVWSESIIAAFYGSAYVALRYYQAPNEFNDVDSFDYLSNNVNLEELDRNTERLLGIRGDDKQSEKVWNIVYSFVASSTPILEGVEPASDLDAAIKDASESAYIMGMLLAMRYHEQMDSASLSERTINDIKGDSNASQWLNTPNERSFDDDIFYSGQYILCSERRTPFSIKDFYSHSPCFDKDDYDLLGFPIRIVDRKHPFVYEKGKFYFAAVNHRGPVEKEILLEIIPAEGEELQKWLFVESHRKPDMSYYDVLVYEELKMWGILERTDDPNNESGCVLKNAILEYSDKRAAELFSCSVRYDFSFEMDNATSDLNLKRYMGNDSRVVIPNTVKGHKVVSIGTYAFNCDSLKKVVLPDSVKRLGYKAFSGNSIVSVELGNETEIEELDKSGIYSAKNNKYYTIIDGVVFTKDCKTLLAFSKKIHGSYHIPEGVENIEHWGLLEAQLDDLYFPRSIKHIGEGIFENGVNNTNISRIHFPSMHITFDDEAFGFLGPSDIEIYAPDGSDAIAYAKKWEVPYVIES